METSGARGSWALFTALDWAFRDRGTRVGTLGKGGGLRRE